MPRRRDTEGEWCNKDGPRPRHEKQGAARPFPLPLPPQECVLTASYVVGKVRPSGRVEEDLDSMTPRLSPFK